MTPEVLAERIGHGFAKLQWLRQALTHRSHSAQHNERLEFLGDAVLNFAITRLLFARWPQASEGELTRLRASLVREETLAEIARSLELSEALTLGSAERKSGAWRRDSILADALEAVFGAVLQDAGIDAASAVIERVYGPRLDAHPSTAMLKDAKTLLQEHLQAQALPLPEYRVIQEFGPPHRRVFKVACKHGEGPSLQETEALGPSRRQAEQDAARAMLQILTTTAAALR